VRATSPILLLAVCIAAAGLVPERAAADSTDRVFPDPDPGEGRVSLRLAPGAEPLGFEVDRMSQRIAVFEPGAAEPSHVLFCEWTEGPPRGRSGLSARDYDGDGVRDLEVISWWGATGNIGYLVFRFDPASRRFFHSPLYSGLSRPEPDGTGCVQTSGVAGHAGAIYSREKLCPRDGALAPVFRERQAFDRDAEHYVFTRQHWDAEGELECELVEHRRRGPGGLEATAVERRGPSCAAREPAP